MPAWPSLPLPRSDGFAETLGKQYATFTSDKPGVDLRRRVTTNAPDDMQFSMSCTAAQVATLKTFYRTTVNGGSLRFTFTHPITGATVNALFASEPQYQPKPGVPRFLVTVRLKILP